MDNIVLIGFSGTGKTTTGQILARLLGKTFIDIDSEIEKNCGMTIEKIFSDFGEGFFREKERDSIRALKKRTGTIVATGGGAVLFSENVAELKRCGTIVALHASASVILERLEKDPVGRPLLACSDRLARIEQMMCKRAERYCIADVTVETEGLTPQEVVEAIVVAVGEHRTKRERSES